MCLAVPHTIETILGENRALAAAGAVRTEIRTARGECRSGVRSCPAG